MDWLLLTCVSKFNILTIKTPKKHIIATSLKVLGLSIFCKTEAEKDIFATKAIIMDANMPRIVI